jgi:NAD(P)-dependent dehydrogenase (short-subunit alcohol dehydrogenase family)
MLADDALVDERIRPTAIVTGGASGVGKAVCELLGHGGYLVAVVDRDEIGARSVADACGGIALPADVSNEASVVAMFGRALDVLGGRLDALATAAGAWDAIARGDGDVAALARLHESAVFGTHVCVREAAKRMDAGARICTVAASSHVSDAWPESAVLAAGCAAVGAITRVAARELAGRGIAVNGVVHGALAQSAGAPRFLGSRTADDVAEAVAWLLSSRATRVWGSIVSLETDGAHGAPP